jgi:alkylation response protein AidB-like acyl-CoA dehydrogenase
MNLNLSKAQEEIKKAAWEFARGKFDKEMIIEEAKNQHLPEEILKKAGDLGFIGIHFDESFDGAGMGLFEYVLVCETFCRRDSTLGQALMFSAYAAECLLRFDGGGLCEKFLPPVAGGRMISTGAFLEPEPAAEGGGLRTTARKSPSDWHINGIKSFVPFGDRADFYVLTCATEPDAGKSGDGISMLLVESDREGVQAGRRLQKLGGRMVPFCEVRFENVAVPLSNLIGAEGKGRRQLERFFMENRIQVAAMALGTAQGAFDRALAYVKDRAQFGKKLAEFPETRHKLADMAAEIESARFLTYSAAARFDEGKATARDAATAKLVAARSAMSAADQAVQLLGGYGYMTEYEVEHFYRDAKHAEIFQGAPALQRDLIADAVLGARK